jgi:hypothetical protein
MNNLFKNAAQGAAAAAAVVLLMLSAHTALLLGFRECADSRGNHNIVLT